MRPLSSLTSNNDAHCTTDNCLSVSPHVQSVIASCAQALYALRVLRAHGLSDSTLQTIFRAGVVAKLIYASSAWLGFTTAHDRQRIDAFIGRSKRAGFCATELDDFYTLCTSADKQLFLKVLHNPDHVLHSLLPPPNVQNYNLRRRTHNIYSSLNVQLR